MLCVASQLREKLDLANVNWWSLFKSGSNWLRLPSTWKIKIWARWLREVTGMLEISWLWWAKKTSKQENKRANKSCKGPCRCLRVLDQRGQDLLYADKCLQAIWPTQRPLVEAGSEEHAQTCWTSTNVEYPAEYVWAAERSEQGSLNFFLWSWFIHKHTPITHQPSEDSQGEGHREKKGQAMVSCCVIRVMNS